MDGIAHQAWDEARRRYPPHMNIAAEVFVAPDTDSFRQLARQPGWMLASTQGNRIVTQPEAILQRNGGAGMVFLHEMLHVLVEADATKDTPLWLREGLVEVLAGTVAGQQKLVSVTEIEHGLQKPASWHESQVAHHAAAALVAGLVARYGIGAVRGWLTNGVPAGVLAAVAG